jgi:hypothetical protein
MIKNKNHYLANTERAGVGTDIQIGSETRTFEYTNHESLASDIEFLIFSFLERGSTISKYKDKLPNTLKTITDWLVEKYKINITVNQPLTSLKPDIITIPRIVACFPGKVCQYFHLGLGNAPVTFLDLGITDSKNISRSVLCPQFTALIPREIMRSSTALHFISFLVHVVVDDDLHKKARNFTDLDNIFTYYCAEHNTPNTPQDSRVTVCSGINLLTHDRRRFIPILENQRDFCNNKIRQLRPTDPKLDIVLADLGKLV